MIGYPCQFPIENKLLKIWKSIHKGPVHRIILSSNSIMATGGSDSSVRIWDLKHHACTQNLRGVEGVVSVMAFHPDEDKNILLASGDDLKIHGWNLNNGKEVFALSGHYSKVTSFAFHEDGIHLVSSGRDKILILWNTEKGESIRVLPVYEVVEGLFMLPSTHDIFKSLNLSETSISAVAAGDKGVAKIWDMQTGREILRQSNSLIADKTKDEGELLITQLLWNKGSNRFAIVTSDQDIIIYSLNQDFTCQKQLVGYSDEILDLTYLGTDDTHVTVATNSPNIKLYELATMNCQLFCGHTDLVLSLASTPANKNLLISSAKDHSVRLWLLIEATNQLECLGSAARHTASVGSVFASQTAPSFFVSIGQDSCLKLWDLPKNLTGGEKEVSLNATNTVLAHQKDINSVTVSPNDKFIATGSQDKTAKLWNAENLQLLGVLRGHRRGVWCVRFSPVDQVLLTTSADCTLKLWSLTELNCLKTLEGHESSVVRGEFLSRGTQLITTGADGLIKLWGIKNSECIGTFEQHDNRVWALTVSKDESHLISGGSDSLMVIWRDVTEEKRSQEMESRQQQILEEQQLMNLVNADQLDKAFRLSLKLERPMQTMKITEAILRKDAQRLRETVENLKPQLKESLLRCAITWNTNSKNCQIAQMVMKILLDEIASDKHKTEGLSSTLESLMPYTERHFKRLTRLQQDLHLLNYTVNRMRPHGVSLNGT